MIVIKSITESSLVSLNQILRGLSCYNLTNFRKFSAIKLLSKNTCRSHFLRSSYTKLRHFRTFETLYSNKIEIMKELLANQIHNSHVDKSFINSSNKKCGFSNR